MKRPHKPFLLGIGYTCQQVEKIEVQAWDVRLDAIATEEKIILVENL